MANPQLENGYIKISNELFFALCRMDIKGSEFMVALTVILKTYGWNKKEDKISLTQFQKITSMSRPRVIRAIKNLVTYKILGSNTGDTSTTSTYWVIKDYDKWRPSNRADTSNRLVTRPSNKTRTDLVTHQLHTKDIITKDNKQKTLGRFTPPSAVEVGVYCKGRKNNIKPETFIDFYTARGWKYKGGIAMKDWKAAVRTWEQREKEAPQMSAPNKNYDITIEKKLGKMATREMVLSLMKEIPSNLWWKIDKYLKKRYPGGGNAFVEAESEMLREKNALR